MDAKSVYTYNFLLFCCLDVRLFSSTRYNILIRWIKIEEDERERESSFILWPVVNMLYIFSWSWVKNKTKKTFGLSVAEGERMMKNR